MKKLVALTVFAFISTMTSIYATGSVSSSSSGASTMGTDSESASRPNLQLSPNKSLAAPTDTTQKPLGT
ncbi:MAG: hypothetical protein H0U75_08275 [Legionella sp.]|nr:hypothetical protein [Legionella sp.]